MVEKYRLLEVIIVKPLINEIDGGGGGITINIT